MPGPVAGRGHDLLRLRAVLAEAAASTAKAAVVEGVPGIGKTTVLTAMVREAEEAGFSLMGSRAEELEQQRSFGTIATALRSMALGPDEADILDLLETAGHGDSSFRLMDRLVDLVEQRALRRPVFLWFDDLQWADEWSVRCIGVLHRRLARLPLAVLVATRLLPRGEATAALLRSLTEGGIHLSLSALPDEAVAEVVRHRTGAEPSSRLQAALGRAGGNPFFVRELVDAFERDGMLERAGDLVEVAQETTPTSLFVTVLHRMGSLPASELELVRVAATLGGSFTVHDLAVAAGVLDEDLLEPVLRLRAEGVFSEEGDLLRFRHDLLREAVYEDLGGPVRASLHSRIGHAFHAAGFDSVQVAHHLLRGAAAGDRPAADLMVDAARSGRVTLKESILLLQRALEIAPDRADGPALKRDLGRLLHTTDRPAEAIPLLEEALAEATSAAERFHLMGALAVAAIRAGNQEARWFWRARARELAEDLRDSEDPAVILGIAQCHFDLGDFATAARTAARAIPLAREAGTPGYEEEAENMCCWLLTGEGFPRRALAHSARALSLSAGRPSEPMRLIHHAGARRALWEVGAARAALARAREVACASGAVAIQLKATCNTAMFEYWAGRWDEALLQADTAVEIMQELDITTDDAHPSLIHALLELRRGDPGAARRIVEELGDAANSGLHPAWLELLIATAEGPGPEAGRLAEEVVRRRRDWPFTPLGEGALADAARAALLVGDRPTAAAASELAQHLAEKSEMPSRTLEALTCRTLVEQDDVAAEEAVDLADSCPWPIQKAATLEDAAAVLAGSRDRLLRAASAIYAEVGSLLDYDRVAPLVEVRPQARPVRARPATGWDSLTDAERKVVDLAADGLTNREIGERLFISHRTVGAHLAHIFDKLQIRSRVELARQVAARSQVVV